MHFKKPNSIILNHPEDFKIDRNTIFFGGRDWINFEEDIRRIPQHHIQHFILCLFTIVVIDQNMFTNFRNSYAIFRAKTNYPKFGWTGFGTHMEKPKKILSVAEKKGLLDKIWVQEHEQEYIKLFVKECQWFFSTILPEIRTLDFLDALVNDTDFRIMDDEQGMVFEIIYNNLILKIKELKLYLE